MTIELPVLRLGLAGFTAEQQEAAEPLLGKGAGEATTWEICDIDVADAWWINGARTKTLGNGRIRVTPGVPSGRSLQFELPEVDRPVAFATPLPPSFDALCSFDITSHESVKRVLQQFEAWLSPLTAQFCLASHIVEHQSALTGGTYELRLQSELLAVVDMHGETAVRASAAPQDFDEAVWQRTPGCAVPDDFVRGTLSQLMWQFAVRTQRDVLPRHYRTGLLYFRRAPRLPQRLLKDSQLLIMRELMLAPATFAELEARCGGPDERLARELAALYFVGSITSNPKRAARPVPTAVESNLPSSGLDSVVPSELPAPRREIPADLTAPAPLRPDH